MVPIVAFWMIKQCKKLWSDSKCGLRSKAAQKITLQREEPSIEVSNTGTTLTWRVRLVQSATLNVDFIGNDREGCQTTNEGAIQWFQFQHPW
jgi:hypothetical protein